VEVAGGQLVGDDRRHPSVDQGDVEGHELVEEGDAALDALLVERLGDQRCRSGGGGPSPPLCSRVAADANA
jgi:hypothetical protein